MDTYNIATDDQIAGIRARAVNAATRSFAWAGVGLSHAQADDLGPEAIDWLRVRFGLTIRTTDTAVLCEVRS